MGTDLQVRRYHLAGLDCAEEIAALRQTVGKLAGVEELTFNLLDGVMSVHSCDDATPSQDEIMAAVKRAGLEATYLADIAAPLATTIDKAALARIIASGLLIALGLGLQLYFGSLSQAWWRHFFAPETTPAGAAFAFTVATLLALWGVFPKAWAALARRSPDMNLLMTAAALGAIGINEWAEGASVAFLFAVSLQLEAWSVSRARRSIRGLLDIAPPRARRADGSEAPVAEVGVDELLTVYPGERVPLDGVITSGATSLNEAPITGESLPVAKSAGAEVWAGTINESETFELRVTRAAADTTLSRIIRMVEEAQARRAQAEQWVDLFARVYTPMVFTGAILIAILPPLLLSKSWPLWLYNGLVLLVIACPCALVISTPVSVVAALSAAAGHGVLIKGGVFLEQAARLKAIAFDKTGTITRGEPSVAQVIPLRQGDEADRIVAITAALEQHSNHPLARAILAEAETRRLTAAPAASFKLLAGRGAEGEVDGTSYWLGSHRLLHERGDETPELHRRLLELEDAGHSVVILGSGRQPIGLIAISDTIRPHVAETLRQLRGQGIEHLVMLTGDNRGTAQAVAAAVDMPEVYAELLPQEKLERVSRLVSDLGPTAMVGDGINDAPALAAATVGIAMGAAGSEAAIETADIALMSDDLARLPWLTQHARRALTVIRQNIIFAIAIKVLFIILALFNLATLWMAIVADTGASLLVTLNALRLLRGRSG